MDTQTNNENTIRTFLHGGDINDTALLEKVMHADFQNTQDGFFGQKGIHSFNKSQYIGLVATRKFGGSTRTVEFVSLDQLGSMAVAKVLLESKTLKFTSYIIAVTDGNEWQVVGNYPSVELK